MINLGIGEFNGVYHVFNEENLNILGTFNTERKAKNFIKKFINNNFCIHKQLKPFCITCINEILKEQE
jgi:hypothetical protein